MNDWHWLDVIDKITPLLPLKPVSTPSHWKDEADMNSCDIGGDAARPGNIILLSIVELLFI